MLTCRQSNLCQQVNMRKSKVERPLRMMRGERKQKFAVGERGQSLDKSLRRNISATPHRGWTKGFLSLEFGERRETRLDSEIDSDSGLDPRNR
ncbi:hypothetical protein AVEN_217002-1 [Araneus ventricosus]|uniref:Uncharacterized protein n=1 Tax=Araneus ventricosus TaxID=182803 RepID=A0A4Y2MT20_ARAVE|nr:hypothetical protein AVEN_217002-1 [Araneus ventricosus]